ncbi:hypothetical protein AB0J82_33885 [Asanoa sp. NPDC049518]|uniref:hypothetical protein n=1 Tax=unclassified Asanoa TaxID=2685164 RepID=UPI003428BAD3
MQKRSKRILAATLAAAGVLAVSGVAYALWSQSDAGDVVGGKSETFEPFEVTGTWQGRTLSDTTTADHGLMPTESGIVQLSIPVSSENTMNARITSITGQISDIVNDDQNGCAGFMTLGSYTPTTTMGPSATSYTINLNKAVTLNADAPVGCQGMEFTTRWTVTLDPTRSGPSQSGGSTFSLNPTAP